MKSLSDISVLMPGNVSVCHCLQGCDHDVKVCSGPKHNCSNFINIVIVGASGARLDNIKWG